MARDDVANGSVSDDDSCAEYRDQLTAGQWSRLKKKWFAARADILRGFGQLATPMDITLSVTVLIMALYAVRLIKDADSINEIYDFVVTFILGIKSFFTGFLHSQSGAQGTAAAFVLVAVIVWLLTVLWLRHPCNIYLVDFKTYRHASIGGDPRNTAGGHVTYDRFMLESKAAKHLDGSACFNEKSLEFQEKILKTSGISETTIFPESIVGGEPGEAGADAERTRLTMAGARTEAEQMMFRAVEDVLQATGTKASDIGILIVNCSLFCPTPSLSAMIVNKFNMRPDILSYNLGGMGCSASPISIDLAKRLLRSPEQRNCLALVVSTENITQNWYRGNDRGMLLSNCLFRCGAAAILLSNKMSDRRRARFKLLHTVRTHTGQSDDCYKAVYQEEDGEGVTGVRLSKRIMQVAGDALKINISSLGPLVLPVSEQIYFILNLVARKAVKGQVPLPKAGRKLVQKIACNLVQIPPVSGLVGYKPPRKNSEMETPSLKEGNPKDESFAHALARRLPPYVPDFTRAFQWFCVHTGGRAVIDAIENNLSLPAIHMEPSRVSLYKFGNPSSASIWYELEIISERGNTCGVEREGGLMPQKGTERRLCKGDKIWQIAFGSGFKCNSAVWQAMRNH
eukprot:TRINITY_DN45641_c0_g1_i1.p1 TRINITY_DN45641_c0_g1~~TRINITY_DN45641_c0_g1_i1.p1  ORF type:complete len:626 (+),score=163.01 TRINITY_DN45641_c0_g1_i1:71-1948(+)